MIESGLARRVIIIKNPPGAFFEQAIFIVREGAAADSRRDITKEAQRIIDGMMPRTHKRRISRERVFAASAFALFVGALILLILL